ncbi:hypothetical protein [Rossellomorea aquimaris]|jgi:hypothetical protein|nr:hypothetical protein [Rossellomorea aquimaris]
MAKPTQEQQHEAAKKLAEKQMSEKDEIMSVQTDGTQKKQK